MQPRRLKQNEKRYHEMLLRNFGHVDLSAIDLMRCIGKSYQLMTNEAERELSKRNLSTAKLRILFALTMSEDEGAEGGGLLPSELSRFQGVTPNTMSSLLTSLREAQFIEQVNHPHDRRKRIIKITQAGRDLIREIGPGYLQFQRQLFAALSEEERQILITLLRKLINSIVTPCPETADGAASDDKAR